MTEDRRNPAEEPTLATDAQIQAIVDSHEPGVDALLTAYELVEQHYFSAMAGTAPSFTTAANTSQT